MHEQIYLGPYGLAVMCKHVGESKERIKTLLLLVAWRELNRNFGNQLGLVMFLEDLGFAGRKMSFQRVIRGLSRYWIHKNRRGDWVDQVIIPNANIGALRVILVAYCLPVEFTQSWRKVKLGCSIGIDLRWLQLDLSPLACPSLWTGNGENNSQTCPDVRAEITHRRSF